MSKKRPQRTAAFLLAIILSCGNSYNAIAAEVEKAFTKNMVLSGDFATEEQEEATSSEMSDTNQDGQQEGDDSVQQDSYVEDSQNLPVEEETDPEKSDLADTALSATAASTEDVETAVEAQSTDLQNAGTQAEATEEDLIEEKLEDPIEALESGNTKVSINATEISVYFLDDDYVSDLSIPSGLPTSYQLKVSGYTGKVTYKILSGATYFVVDKNGLITVADYGDFYTAGNGVVRVTAGSDTFDVKVHVVDYMEKYYEDFITGFIKKNVKSGMSDYQEAELIMKYIASLDYDGTHHSAQTMYLYQCGSCWASTDMIMDYLERLGIEAHIRDASSDQGAGGGHRNVLAILDGKTYVLDAGYDGKAPRYYLMKQTDKATYITLDDAEVTIGEAVSITMKLNPADSTDVIKWSSLNPSIATVKNGKVTGISEGKCGIVATGEYTYGVCNVIVKKPPQDQTISFSKISSTSVTKTIGDAAFNLGAKASGGTALSYKSSNPSVASIDKAGKVTIHKAGKATITVTAAKSDEYKEAVKKVTITVIKKTQTISLTSTKLTKAIGDKAFTLGAKANGALSYKSSDPTILTVTKDGLATPLKVGSAVITINAAETDIYKAATAQVTVTVEKKAQKITVPDSDIIKGNAGSIEFDGTAFKLNAKTSGNGKITYKSSDTTVATVGSSNGLVTPKKVGKAEITVTAAETADCKKASLKVTITVTKKKQTITSKNVIKNYGSKAFTLSCTVLDSAPLTFTSSNKDVVTVGKTTGKVTIKSWGEATITIKAAETDKYQSATKKIKVTVLKHGWITDNGKKGHFVKGVPSVGIVTISGNTYGFDQEGYLLYGLQKIDGDTFFMDEKGIVTTGWQTVDGRNYYFSPEASEGHLRGAAVTGWNTIDGATFYMDANGRAASGFKNIDGAQYYFDAGNGCKMATGWNTINGFSYYMGTNGVIRTGFKNIDGSQYYFWPETANGHYKGTMAKNWQTLNGFKYYMGSDGIISTGFRTIGGKKYYFWPATANGHYKGTMATGWPAIDGQKYYAGTDGVIRTGWQTLNGFKYYMGSDGAIRTGFKNIDGRQYYFWPETANGKYRGTMATKWNTINGFRYYMGSDGAIRTGWQTIDGKRYYFWPDTANGHYKGTLKK